MVILMIMRRKKKNRGVWGSFVSQPHFLVSSSWPSSENVRNELNRRKGGKNDCLRKDRGAQYKGTQQQTIRRHLSHCECVHKHQRCTN
eukprot:11652956-Ditylum_brightwellii.AAC.1